LVDPNLRGPGGRFSLADSLPALAAIFAGLCLFGIAIYLARGTIRFPARPQPPTKADTPQQGNL
jgi:hypothetical protein